MNTLWHDIRYGLRILGRRPGFAAVVVAILGVAIGANTAIFSVVNTVMLRPLPYENPDRIVRIEQEGIPWKEGFYHRPNFALLREQNNVFAALAGYCFRSSYVEGIEASREVGSFEVTWDLFSVLGVQPELGRSLLPADEKPGSTPVVALSHAFWQNDLGGDPEIIGKNLALTQSDLDADVETVLTHKQYTIIGVMPAGFTFPIGRSAPFWIPIVPDEDAKKPFPSRITPLARLKQDVTEEQANAALTVLAARLRPADSSTETDGRVVFVQRLLDHLVEGHRKPPLLLLGAAGFVLLIACSNVANLFLARATARRREMAMRAALGASRRRIMRQMLTESLLLSLAAGLLGLLLTFATLKGLVHLCPADIPRLDETSVNPAVLGFTLGVSVLTGLLFGVMPAWRTSEIGVIEILKKGTARTTGDRRWRRLHSGLVITQVGLSLVLLIGAALLIRSLAGLATMDLGFRPEHVLTTCVELPEAKYPEGHRRTAFFATLLERLQTLPDVRSAAVVYHLSTLTGERMLTGFSIPDATGAEQQHIAQILDVSPDFFPTMGIKLLRGRTFTAQDWETGHVVVDRTLAQKYFPDVDPLGKKLGDRMTIVGVVDTTRDFLTPEPPEGLIYSLGSASTGAGIFLVRTDGDPAALIPAIRMQVTQLEKDRVIKTIEPLSTALSALLAPRRFVMILLGLFAGIALALAMIGIYGLLQYRATQQTRDIGIRMALGARRGDVLTGVLVGGLKLVLIGIGLGIAGAAAVTRVLASLLYDTTATDPATFVGVSIAVGSVALLACYLPARRAAKVDPMEALRYE